MPVFGLPGNPAAARVSALIFARAALDLMGRENWRSLAAFAKSKRRGRRENFRARLNDDGAAEVFVSEGLTLVSGLVQADGLVELPDGAAEITPRSPVRYPPHAGFRSARYWLFRVYD